MDSRAGAKPTSTGCRLPLSGHCREVSERYLRCEGFGNPLMMVSQVMYFAAIEPYIDAPQLVAP